MRRTHKLLITFGVVGAAAMLIGLDTSANAGPEALGVADAKRDAKRLVDTPVQVRGAVVAASVAMNESRLESFVIEDDLERLRVEYGGPTPDNFGPKDVVVRGQLRIEPDGTVVLSASEIQVGCSSKY